MTADDVKALVALLNYLRSHPLEGGEAAEIEARARKALTGAEGLEP